MGKEQKVKIRVSDKPITGDDEIFILLITRDYRAIEELLTRELKGMARIVWAGKTASEMLISEIKRIQLLKDSDDSFLAALTSIIENQMDNPILRVEQICVEMSMSQSVLYRKLKDLTGHSFVPFVRNIRLARAKKLLMETTMTQSEVAFAVGFSDVRFFSRVFFREFDIRAIDYRKNTISAAI